MASYKIVLHVEASRIDTLRKKVAEAFPECTAQVEKMEFDKSRADRLASAEASFEDAKNEVSELKDEMQNWLDSLPENLQQGSKASEIEDCISALEDIESNMDGVDFGNVSFPGMY